MPIQQVKIQVEYWKGIKLLVSEWQVLIFFFVALIGGMGLASIHNYLYLFLESLGAGKVMMGTALTIATASELVVMYFADRLLKAWKAKGGHLKPATRNPQLATRNPQTAQSIYQHDDHADKG